MKNSNSQNFKAHLDALRLCAKSFSSEQPPTIYVAWGISDYLLLKTSDVIKKSWLKHSGENAIFHDASALAKEGLSSVFESEGLFSQTNLHIVRRAETIKDLAKKITKLGDLNTANHILFCLETKTNPQKLLKALPSKNIMEIPCFPPKTFELTNFIGFLSRSKKVTLDQNAQSTLLQSLGEDLFAIDNALEKLSIEFYDQQIVITSDMVAKSCAVIREDHVFKLTNHILANEKAKAQLLVTNLLSRGTEPLSILGILTKHLRTAASFTNGPSKDHGYLPGFVKNQYTAYARSRGVRGIKTAIDTCHLIDVRFKSSRKVSPQNELASLIDIL